MFVFVSMICIFALFLTWTRSLFIAVIALSATGLVWKHGTEQHAATDALLEAAAAEQAQSYLDLILESSGDHARTRLDGDEVGRGCAACALTR